MAYLSRPVPQNIMSVEFKVFDIMTLKQFIISFVLLFISIILFMFLEGAWKFVLPGGILFVGGVVVFVPFNGEPFQEFVSSFLEAMISPQRRVWHKKGVIVRTAAQKAMAYRYGSDYIEGEELKFNTAQKIRTTPEQQNLDKEEEKFLKHELSDQSSSYSPPATKKVDNSNLKNPMISGTNVSSKSVQASVDLNQFTQPVSNNAQLAQSQLAPQQVQEEMRVPVHLAKEESSNPKSQIPNSNNTQTPQQPSTEAIKQPQVTSQNQASQNTGPQIQMPAAQPSLQSQPSADVNQSLRELQSIMPPKKENPEEDELAPRNYIFGSVEDDEEKGIAGAAVVLKQGEENLEVLYTNETGEFQSFYEYKAGQYILYVNVGAKEFNEVIVDHDPIDPMPVIIKSKYPKQKDAIEKSNNDEFIKSSSGEVFDGTYDSKFFDMGQNYVEADEKLQQPQVANSKSEILNSREQRTENREQRAKQTEEIGDIAQQNPIIESGAANGNQPAGNVQQSAGYINYLMLPNAQVSFDQSYTNIPNTLNGMILDTRGNLLQGVLVHLIDQNGSIVRTVASDPTGRFYTFAPLSSGKYNVECVKDGYTFSKYFVQMEGSLIYPKIIQSIN